jgi:glycosyltransferase involved in cell wall biosynthesis
MERGVRVIRIANSYPQFLRQWIGVFNPSMVLKALRVLREYQPDIIHIHNVHTYFSFSVFLVARLFAPTFATAHDAMMINSTKVTQVKAVSLFDRAKFARYTWNPFREFLIKLCVSGAKIFAVSHALKAVLETNDLKIIAVIHNGLNISKFEQKNYSEGDIKKLNSRYSIPDSAQCILFGGRASAAKGVYVAIDSMKLIRKKFPQAVLLIVGVDTKTQAHLREYVQKASLLNAVICIDWIPRDMMPLLYKRSACVVVPSQYIDPLPTIIIESMLMKAPVIVTNLGGAAEIVNKETGYIGQPNANFIVDSVAEILNNPHTTKMMVDAAYTRARNDFSQERFIKDVISWYDRK